MTATNESLSVLEKCEISAPPNTVGKRSVQLSFFDIIFLTGPSVYKLFFYNFTDSKTHFIQTLIPTLKHSLSITLQHFFSFAAKLTLFPNSPTTKPEIRHVEGDSIQLTFAECNNHDFNHLKANHPQNRETRYSLVPMLGGATTELSHDDDDDDEYVTKIPLFSVQVTLFPSSGGFTIGITNHHILCDANSMFDFLRAWTSIAKNGTDELFLASGVNFPIYDRLIKYPKRLDEIYLNLNQAVAISYKPPQIVPDVDEVLRATIVFTGTHINALKKWAEIPSLDYVSSFSVLCGFLWSCKAKSRAAVAVGSGEKNQQGDDDDELEMFLCAVDWRTRMEHPVPQSYFGNCIGTCATTTKSSLLSGPNGFVTAVEEIGKSILKTTNNKGGLMKDAETWFKYYGRGLSLTMVSNSPKLKVYDLDFGWGKPAKFEVVFIGRTGSISFAAGKDSPQDIEIGLCLPAKQMEAFIDISRNELDTICAKIN